MLWAWRRQLGPFLLGELEKVFPVKKALPERHGDWISEITAGEI